MCDWILGGGSGSCMKYTVLLHVFDVISVIVYVFLCISYIILGISAMNSTQHNEMF